MRNLGLLLVGLVGFVLVGCGGDETVQGRSWSDQLADNYEQVHASQIDGATLELWAQTADRRCATWVTRLADETIASVETDCLASLRSSEVAMEIEQRDVCVNSAQIHNSETAESSSELGGAEEIFCFYDVSSGADIAFYPREDVRGVCLQLKSRSAEGDAEMTQILELAQGQWTTFETAGVGFDVLAPFGPDGDLIDDGQLEISDEQSAACSEAVLAQS